MRGEGDIVLIYHENRPSVYARIESIEPDIKKDWYQVSLLLLTIPAQGVTWILRGSYIEGAPFTMGGIPMKLEEVKKHTVGLDKGEPEKEQKEKGSGRPATVIPFKKP